jgi:hypothetical protein
MPVSLPSASENTTTCYTKTAWADSWTEQPLLQAISITDQVAPGHSSAMLRYRYGKAMLPAMGSRAEDTAIGTIARGGLIAKYVKIVVSGLGTWWGVIVDLTDARSGALGGTVSSGVEQYTAFALTWFLDQVPILKTHFRAASTTEIIDRCIPFNGGTDGQRRANRVSWKNYDSTNKVFTDRTRTAAPEAWTAANAIEYVFDKFAPRNAADAILIPFALQSGALSFLDYEIGMIEYEGQTPWQLINRLIDHKRGLGCHAIIDSNTVKLVVWSQNAASITLPSGSSIPANPNTMTYDFDSAVNVSQVSVSSTAVAKYDQVIVRGERAGSVFSVRPATNMEKDWTSADQTKYDQGASLKPGYSVLASDADKQAANNDARASDPLARVYSWWKPKATWDGRSATDPATGTAPFCFPKIDSDGVPDTGTAAVIQHAGLRVETFLPLRQGVDYSAAAITPDTDGSDDSETEFIPPILLLKSEAIRGSTSDAGWIHGERLNQSVSANSSKRPYDYSVDLSVREDAPGLIFRTVGQPQHYLAKDLFVPALGAENLSSDAFNSPDWIATIYMLQDQWCRAQWPLQASLPSLDLIRPLTLQVAGAHMDYVVPGTIVAVDAGELKKSALGGYVRDDREKLKDIARLAYAWHGQTRRIMQLSFKGITSGFSLGYLITSIGSGGLSETVNTCVTSITYDLAAGTTSLSTSFGELDFTS